MTRRGLAGGQLGHFGGWFDQKTHFPTIWFSWMVFNPMIWTADQLIMLRQIFTDLTNEFWILDMPQRGPPGVHGGRFGGRFDQKYHFPTIWSPLNGLQPLHLDCWLASYVGIGPHRPFERVLDTWYDSQGLGRGSGGAFWWPILQKISFFDHLVLLNGLNPFIWTADRLLLLEYALTNLTIQF